ncbi:hypothetical protein [Emticicia sp. SJ17W-69]|uniref:hypothetical protein n=1 Tax=Emticicia sp. SJ17W-69 TaxID=3421657 RepID=UPI003EBC6C5A
MKNHILSLSLLFSINAFGQGSLTLTPVSSSEFLMTTFSQDPEIITRRSSGLNLNNLAANIVGINLGVFGAAGDNGTSFTNPRATIIMTTTENWTTTANGTKMSFFTTANGTTITSEKFTINHDGKIGIGNGFPLRKLHVADGFSGATPLSSEDFFFENNATSYIGIAVPNASETGILFGKAATAASGGVIYSPTNDMSFRTGGNNTRMLITSAGNVSIGTGAAPTEKLEINGTSKIGINGTPITEIIKVTRTANIFSTPAGTESTLTFQIPNVQVGSTVYISPSINLPDGLIIAHSLSGLNFVEVKFFNASAVTVDPPSMDFYITVIR